MCNRTEGSPPGSAVPAILQARTLKWVAISFSNAWKWKVKVKSLSRVRLLVTPWTAAHQAPPSMGFPGESTGVGCHYLLRHTMQSSGIQNELLQRLLLQGSSFPSHVPTLYPKICCLVTQLCPSLLQPCGLHPTRLHCPWDFSQARVLEWVAISFSSRSFQPRDQTCIFCVAGRLFITEPPGKPKVLVYLIHSTSVYIFV